MEKILINEHDGYQLEIMDNYGGDGKEKLKQNPDADVFYVGINDCGGDCICAIGLSLPQIDELINKLQVAKTQLLKD